MLDNVLNTLGEENRKIKTVTQSKIRVERRQNMDKQSVCRAQNTINRQSASIT